MKNIQINELYFVNDWNGDVELLWVEEHLEGDVYKCRKLRNVGDEYEPNKDDTPYLVCKDRFVCSMKDWVLTTITTMP